MRLFRDYDVCTDVKKFRIWHDSVRLGTITPCPRDELRGSMYHLLADAER